MISVSYKFIRCILKITFYKNNESVSIYGKTFMFSRVFFLVITMSEFRSNVYGGKESYNLEVFIVFR